MLNFPYFSQYTATESTNYYFDVEASKLQDAIDRFAQFFQTPLFSVSSMERELQAVDSEHSNNKNEDSWRLFQVSLRCSSYATLKVAHKLDVLLTTSSDRLDVAAVSVRCCRLRVFVVLHEVDAAGNRPMKH